VLKHVALYGLLGGALIATLRWVEYRWLVLDHTLEIYGGVVAMLFAAVGVWIGVRLKRAAQSTGAAPVTRSPDAGAAPADSLPLPADATAIFARDAARVAALGLTPRELEMLELVAAGLSNKEIAAREFVSENTVKTHLSRVFDKLGARRRTQAVQLAKSMRLIA